MSEKRVFGVTWGRIGMTSQQGKQPVNQVANLAQHGGWPCRVTAFPVVVLISPILLKFSQIQQLLHVRYED